MNSGSCCNCLQPVSCRRAKYVLVTATWLEMLTRSRQREQTKDKMISDESGNTKNTKGQNTRMKTESQVEDEQLIMHHRFMSLTANTLDLFIESK